MPKVCKHVPKYIKYSRHKDINYNDVIKEGNTLYFDMLGEDEKESIAQKDFVHCSFSSVDCRKMRDGI
jgi:hypothetical protein